MCLIPRMTGLPSQECRWQLFLRRPALLPAEPGGSVDPAGGAYIPAPFAAMYPPLPIGGAQTCQKPARQLHPR
jgi:hypothetical protein